jgi:putative flippase GtrA
VSPASKAIAVRWLKFNFVGGIGIGVQLATLALLVHVFKLPYLVATAAAVETAVLHNFVWHERFTWVDRTRDSQGRQIAGRLVRFHAGNGAISILGNLLLMRLLVGSLGLEPLIANSIAIAACALLNFAAGEWFVFRG